MPLKLEIEQIQSTRIVGCRAWVVADGFGPNHDKPVAITPDCVTLDQFEREVTRLHRDLTDILEEARQKFPGKEDGACFPPMPRLPLP